MDWFMSLTWSAWAQLGIALFGVSAVACSQSNQAKTRRWASVLGLVGQPFWFYATWKAQQWGMFGLCFLYTWAWGKGFWNNWIMQWPTQLWLAKNLGWWTSQSFRHPEHWPIAHVVYEDGKISDRLALGNACEQAAAFGGVVISHEEYNRRYVRQAV